MTYARSQVAVAVGAFVVVALLWSAVVLVDVFDVFGSRTLLFVRGDELVERPALFRRLFDNQSLVEWLQWGSLVGASVAAGFAAGRLHVLRGRRAAAPVLCLAAFVGGLVAKDAGSPRHVLRRELYELTGSSFVRAVSELAVFAVVGVLGAAVLVAIWPIVRDAPRARNPLLGGYLAYGLAAGMSASTLDGIWYPAAGAFVQRTVFGDRMLEFGSRDFYLMDSLVEESIELFAAALLLVAALGLVAESRVVRRDGDT